MPKRKRASSAHKVPESGKKRFRYATSCHSLDKLTYRPPLRFPLRIGQQKIVLNKICQQLSRGCECSSCCMALDKGWLTWEMNALKPLSPIYDILEFAMRTPIDLETVRARMYSDKLWRNEKPDGRQFLLLRVLDRLGMELNPLLKEIEHFYLIAGPYLKEFDLPRRSKTEAAALLQAVSVFRPRLTKLTITKLPFNSQRPIRPFKMLKQVLESSQSSLKDLTFPVKHIFLLNAVLQTQLQNLKSLTFSGKCGSETEQKNVQTVLSHLCNIGAPLTQLSITYKLSNEWLIPKFADLVPSVHTLTLGFLSEYSFEWDVLRLFKAQGPDVLEKTFSEIVTLVAHFAVGLNVLCYLISSGLLPKLQVVEIIYDRVYEGGFFRYPMERLRVIGPFLKRLSIKTKSHYFRWMELHTKAIQENCPRLQILQLECEIVDFEQLPFYLESVTSLTEVSISHPEFAETLMNNRISETITNALHLTSSRLERIHFTTFVCKPYQADQILQKHHAHVKCFRMICSSYEISSPRKYLINLVDAAMLYNTAKKCLNLENLDFGFFEGSYINQIKDRYDIPPYTVQEMIKRTEETLPRIRDQSRDWTTPHIPEDLQK